MWTFLDSAYVIALTSVRDQDHARALALADEYDGEPLLTTDAVLLEIGNALARRNRSAATAMIQRLLAADHVSVVRLTPELFERAFSLYSTHRDKEWGLTDCISFVVMRDEGMADALTSDRHFVQAGFRALMRSDS
jgi:predicted nucleic acid-binding protein